MTTPSQTTRTRAATVRNATPAVRERLSLRPTHDLIGESLQVPLRQGHIISSREAFDVVVADVQLEPVEPLNELGSPRIDLTLRSHAATVQGDGYRKSWPAFMPDVKRVAAMLDRLPPATRAKIRDAAREEDQ